MVLPRIGSGYFFFFCVLAGMWPGFLCSAIVRARQVLNDPRNLRGSVADLDAEVSTGSAACSAAVVRRNAANTAASCQRVSDARPPQFAQSVRKLPGLNTASSLQVGRGGEQKIASYSMCFLGPLQIWMWGVSIKATGRVPIRRGLRPIAAGRDLIGWLPCSLRLPSLFPRFRSRARVAVNPPPPPPDLRPWPRRLIRKVHATSHNPICSMYSFPPSSLLLDPVFLFPRDCSGGARALHRRRADSEAIQIQGAGCSIPTRHTFYCGPRFYYFACTSYISSLLWVYPAR
jgi:hypothetical protein